MPSWLNLRTAYRLVCYANAGAASWFFSYGQEERAIVHVVIAVITLVLMVQDTPR